MTPLFATTYTWTPLICAALGQVFVGVVVAGWAEAGGGNRREAEGSDAPAASAGSPPWEQPGAVRRDREPSRGTTLLWLGRLSLCLIAIPCGLGVLAGLAAPLLAVAVLVMAERDRAKMRAGLMDPDDDGLTDTGARYAVGTLVLSILVLLGVACFLWNA